MQNFINRKTNMHLYSLADDGDEDFDLHNGRLLIDR